MSFVLGFDMGDLPVGTLSMAAAHALIDEALGARAGPVGASAASALMAAASMAARERRSTGGRARTTTAIRRAPRRLE